MSLAVWPGVGTARKAKRVGYLFSGKPFKPKGAAAPFFLRTRERERGDGRPSDTRPPSTAQVGGRRALRAHATLFVNDVALFVELAEDRVEEALGVEIGPELHTVRRQRVEVDGGIGVGAGIHADGAGAVDNLAELVRHDELLRLVDG